MRSWRASASTNLRRKPDTTLLAVPAVAAAKSADWTGHDTRLPLFAPAGIALIVVRIAVLTSTPSSR